jgi:hypothetical protein
LIILNKHTNPIKFHSSFKQTTSHIITLINKEGVVDVLHYCVGIKEGIVEINFILLNVIQCKNILNNIFRDTESDIFSNKIN